MILAPPAGDAFNFSKFTGTTTLKGLQKCRPDFNLTCVVVVDLQSYPNYLFYFALTLGVFLIRYRRSRLQLPRTEFRAWTAAVVFYLAVCVLILVMPWYPPAGGATGGDVSFWYATYCVVGIGM